MKSSPPHHPVVLVVAGDTARMKMDVNQRKKTTFSTKQTGCQIQRNPIQEEFRQTIEPQIRMDHQQKRSQEMPAELTIGAPRFSFPVLFK